MKQQIGKALEAIGWGCTGFSFLALIGIVGYQLVCKAVGC